MLNCGVQHMYIMLIIQRVISCAIQLMCVCCHADAASWATTLSPFMCVCYLFNSLHSAPAGRMLAKVVIAVETIAQNCSARAPHKSACCCCSGCHGIPSTPWTSSIAAARDTAVLGLIHQWLRWRCAPLCHHVRSRCTEAKSLNPKKSISFRNYMSWLNAHNNALALHTNTNTRMHTQLNAKNRMYFCTLVP